MYIYLIFLDFNINNGCLGTVFFFHLESKTLGRFSPRPTKEGPTGIYRYTSKQLIPSRPLINASDLITSARHWLSCPRGSGSETLVPARSHCI